MASQTRALYSLPGLYIDYRLVLRKLGRTNLRNFLTLSGGETTWSLLATCSCTLTVRACPGKASRYGIPLPPSAHMCAQVHTLEWPVSI